MQLFTTTERRFFRHSTTQQVQHFNIHRKRQWMKRARSIIGAFERKQNNNDTGNPLILLRAMGIQQHSRDLSQHDQYKHNHTNHPQQYTLPRHNDQIKLQKQKQQKYINICLSVKHVKNSATSKIRGKYI